jgi:hypothetical protein
MSVVSGDMPCGHEQHVTSCFTCDIFKSVNDMSSNIIVRPPRNNNRRNAANFTNTSLRSINRSNRGYNRLVQIARQAIETRVEAFREPAPRVAVPMRSNTYLANRGAGREKSSLENFPIEKMFASESFIATKKMEDCAICMGPILKKRRARYLECFHCYHNKCINTWAVRLYNEGKEKVDCPQCRN